MGVSGDQVVYPSPKHICAINERHCRETGGHWEPPHNLRASGQLEYLVEKLQGSLFEQTLVVSLVDKAACLAAFIIIRHVFNDGNKRTAMFAAWEFLEANGVHLILDETGEDLALRLARGEARQDDLTDWLEARIAPP